ncbi:MAG: response regulator transcription factor [Rubrivivax sp.]|nr:response regulator transcription factor [Rubrivivax sp.]
MKIPMRVLVADDHPLVRDALARTLAGALPLSEVLQAQDWAGVQARLRDGGVDLALVDLHMPGMNGLDGVRALRQAHPALPIVIASGDGDPATIRNVLALGVRGYLPKSENPDVLVQALTLVGAGGTYVPARAMDDLAAAATPARSDVHGLTPRQLDVLRCLVRGLPNKLIARELALTEGTVKIHIAAILRVLGARNRTEAVVRAREAGLAP